jgi:hypothetical protein
MVVTVDTEHTSYLFQSEKHDYGKAGFLCYRHRNALGSEAFFFTVNFRQIESHSASTSATCVMVVTMAVTSVEVSSITTTTKIQHIFHFLSWTNLKVPWAMEKNR